MKQIKFIDDLCNDISLLGFRVSGNFRHEIFNKIAELRSDIVFFKKCIASGDKSIFQSVLIKYASDYNYESGFFFKRNYDLNEGWTAFLDAYRDGKVKSIKEWVTKKRQGKRKNKEKKAAPDWINQVFSIGDKDYKMSDIMEYIDFNRVPVSELSVAALVETNFNKTSDAHPNSSDYPGTDKFVERAENSSLTFPIIAISRRDGMEIIDGLHRLWKARTLGHEIIKGYVLRDTDFEKIPFSNSEPIVTEAAQIAPIDSYCYSEDNLDYWNELDDEDSEAVKDFVEYIKEIKC